MTKKKFGSLLLIASLVTTLLFSACTTGGGTGSSGGSKGPIKVGVVNNPPSESGYREANVKDMEAVFSKENGYELKAFYSLKNDEQ
ncbi:MAG: sugar ABC transporter substrate-binding protein, partial [Lachnospiraceae bacterium]|nr:sugar ABC transporter substrate-binding protein [Lachnospiraceae bacterium]